MTNPHVSRFPCDAGEYRDTQTRRQVTAALAGRRKRPAWSWRATLAAGLAAGSLCIPLTAQADEELVSFRCALAIDAVLAKLDTSVENLVIQQAMAHINDVNGQMVCIPMSADEIQVRLQSTEMTGNDNRLVFSLDARTYEVRKTFYGR